MRTTDGRLYVGAADGGRMVPITGEVQLSYEDDPLCDALSTPAFPTHEVSITLDAIDFDNFAEALCALGTVFHATTSEINALALRMQRTVGPTLRHDYVWQYRKERKGCRKGRAKRRSLRLTTTYHNVTATCDGDTLTFNANA